MPRPPARAKARPGGPAPHRVCPILIHPSAEGGPNEGSWPMAWVGMRPQGCCRWCFGTRGVTPGWREDVPSGLRDAGRIEEVPIHRTNFRPIYVMVHGLEISADVFVLVPVHTLAATRRLHRSPPSPRCKDGARYTSAGHAFPSAWGGRLSPYSRTPPPSPRPGRLHRPQPCLAGELGPLVGVG